MKGSFIYLVIHYFYKVVILKFETSPTASFYSTKTLLQFSIKDVKILFTLTIKSKQKKDISKVIVKFAKKFLL